MVKKTNVQITSEYIKLDSFLKLVGICGTGGEAKQLVQSGQVLVNGQVCTQRGRKLRHQDMVAMQEDSQTVYCIG